TGGPAPPPLTLSASIFVVDDSRIAAAEESRVGRLSDLSTPSASLLAQTPCSYGPRYRSGTSSDVNTPIWTTSTPASTLISTLPTLVAPARAVSHPLCMCGDVPFDETESLEVSLFSAEALHDSATSRSSGQ
ncbi:hypothetical protein DQ04_07521000, partial [Trypanosoma grayi]|uniref:hypothetical protein n=1 Tax=Trypanosoma grayi TaxID=71804 RepID=UPI0004F49D78